jgi:alpha-N-acetylglucosamine transferase
MNTQVMIFIGFTVVNLLISGIGLIALGYMIKLYTEYFKDRSKSNRQ